jgi:hypothetical protein
MMAIDSKGEKPEPPAEPALATYAHDFEPTIQPYILNQSELLGILNFSALWHEVVYLNDIAIGDNPHLIRSFLDPSQTRLYVAVTEFIRSGVLRCHFRDKVAIRGKVLVEAEPSLTEIYRGWVKDGPQERFSLQEFGNDRERYNKVMDELFKNFPDAVVRYDPNSTKPAFRSHVRRLLDDGGSDLRLLIDELPKQMQRQYLKICNSPYFTNADLWRLIKDIEGAKDLIVAHGHINQQCCADSVHAGMTGAELSRLGMSRFNWNINVGQEFNLPMEPPESLDEIAERAEFTLRAPALDLLGLLTPDQVLQLREEANRTIFKTAAEGPQALGIDRVPQDYLQLKTLMGYSGIAEYQKKYAKVLADYWQHVCAFLEKTYPQESRTKRNLYIISYEKLPQIPTTVRTAALIVAVHIALNHIVPVEHGDPLSKLIPSGVLGGFLSWVLGKFGYHVLLEQTSALKEIREKLPREAWKLKGAYLTNRWS